jgi:hypothetical protein
MARDRLFIKTEDYRYRIAWFIAETGDEGMTLGEEVYTEKQLANAKDDDKQHIAVTLAASKTAGVTRDGRYGYSWATKREAQAALKACNNASKLKTSWPEWAVKAQSAGWKPPKNWKL